MHLPHWGALERNDEFRPAHCTLWWSWLTFSLNAGAPDGLLASHCVFCSHSNVHFCTCIPLGLLMDFFIEHFSWTYFIALLLLDFFTLLLDLLNINPSCYEFTLTVTNFCSFYVIVFFTPPIAHRRETTTLLFASSRDAFSFIVFPCVLSVLLLFFNSIEPLTLWVLLIITRHKRYKCFTVNIILLMQYITNCSLLLIQTHSFT